MNITVIGTGYVGLVTGSCLSDVGNNVCCVDIDENKINSLNKGVIPIFEDNLDDIVNKSIKENRLSFTTKIRDGIKSSEIIFLAVSTPMDDDGSSKLDYILKAAKDIGRYIDDYKVVIVKSTVPVGTTALIKDTIKKEIDDRGVKVSFDIANNPEFLKEGKAVNDFMRPDRIIVGLENKKLKDLFRELYRPFSMNHEKLIFLDIPSSELTKYAANAMLAMKISFINEISQLCEKIGANVNDVRIGIGSDNRIGYSFIYPSIGFGGSCFPKDVSSLKKQFENVGLTSKTSESTLEINKLQGENFANRILTFFNNEKIDDVTIAIWGITFKPGTDDIRESQAIKILDMLLQSGFSANIIDPQGMQNAQNYYENNPKVKFYKDKYETLKNADALALLTEWKDFHSPDFDKIKESMNMPVIFDGRNIYNRDTLLSKGFKHFQIGVSESS